MGSINMALLRQARNAWNKTGFVAAGDPAMGAAPAGDPAAMGAAPSGDPAAMGATPPAGDPAAAGGAIAGGGDPMASLMPVIQMAVQQALASQGGGQSGPQAGGGGIKPKIDVNVEIMQIKKMLAKIVDALGIHIPAQDMVATPEDLNQIAQGGAGHAAITPDNKNGGGLGQIQPVQPLKAAAVSEPWETGRAYAVADSLLTQSRVQAQDTAEKAVALLLGSRR